MKNEYRIESEFEGKIVDDDTPEKIAAAIDMSYSRWSESKWYTFHAHRGTSSDIQDQVFSVCGVADFTYGELKSDIDACVLKCVQNARATESEGDELREYMQEFLEDIESENQEEKNSLFERAQMKTEKWKPKCGDVFWFFIENTEDPGMIINCGHWEIPSKINDYFFGVYRTKREAQAALKKLKKFIKEEL